MIHLKFKNETAIDEWPRDAVIGDNMDIRFMITEIAPLDDGDIEVTLELTDLDV